MARDAGGMTGDGARTGSAFADGCEFCCVARSARRRLYIEA